MQNEQDLDKLRSDISWLVDVLRRNLVFLQSDTSDVARAAAGVLLEALRFARAKRVVECRAEVSHCKRLLMRVIERDRTEVSRVAQLKIAELHAIVPSEAQALAVKTSPIATAVTVSPRRTQRSRRLSLTWEDAWKVPRQ